jgi:protein gp37
MGSKTGIEWTDATWNPIRGCTRVSDGCRNCYAEKVAYRFSGPGQPYEGLAERRNGHASWTGKVRLVEKHLLDPLRWKTVTAHTAECNAHREGFDFRTQGPHQKKCACPARPRRIFVNSMSDLFHEQVPDEWIDRIFAVMALCPQHMFQVLTKRPQRMLEYLQKVSDEKDIQRWANAACDLGIDCRLPATLHDREWPLPNVWLGVSAEDQKTADARIPLLLQTPAAVRFMSAEPLLGAVNLVEMENTVCRFNPLPAGYEKAVAFYLDSLRGCRSCVLENCDAREEEAGWIPKLDWVIVGGESGPGARPMHPDWARSLRDQCVAAQVPFFFKQWGEWAPGECVERNKGTVQTASWFNNRWLFAGINLSNDEGHIDDEPEVYRMGKHAAGALLDGREWREFPKI